MNTPADAFRELSKEEAVARASTRSKRVRSALLANAALDAIVAVTVVLSATGLGVVVEYVSIAVGWVNVAVSATCAVMFLMWLSASHRALLLLSPRPTSLRFSGRQLVEGWLIPIVNLVRPFRGMRYMLEEADPSDLPPPKPEPIADAMGYRDNAGRVPTYETGRPVYLRLWWAAWLLPLPVWGLSAVVPKLSLPIQILCSVLNIFAALMAVRIVECITLRLGERARRLGALPERV